ncbi:MAG: TonB-dependent hemoglobin/transferrin/lactoferrin family receptor [Xanthomonadales bacterium]|nr:TonB-dependent hemoglobin/transferrin/lactoferrin family receptor [Xanthomonadales bacterium]
MRMPPAVLVFSLAVHGAAFTASARAGATPGAAVELDRVTITATRSQRPVQDTPGTVTVRDEADIDRELAADIRDLVRYEPGVSVANAPGRFGLSGFTIRGLDGNRVLVEVDGVRIPDAFAIGSFASAGRDLVDIDLLKSVEIIRGAASSLYGSNALAGVVSFATRDPEDYLGDQDGGHLGAKLGWHGVDHGRQAGFTAALGDDRLGFLLGFAHRQGSENRNQGQAGGEGPARTRPNPQAWETDSALAKVVWRPAPAHRLAWAFEAGQGRTLTEVLSARTRTASPAALTEVLALAGDDRRARTRNSLAWLYQPEDGWFDSVEASVHAQRGRTSQETLEQRRSTVLATGVSTPQQRWRRFEFDQEVAGAELLARRRFDWAGGNHLVVLGLESLQTDTAQLRDGLAVNPLTGAQTPVIPPDVFPVRDFPRSRTREQALFVQDEISLAGGRLDLIPGFRLDRYRLDPRPDAIFEEDNPGIEPVALRATQGSPKLGLLWRLGSTWSLAAQFAEGFRAPPYDDANIGFTNLQFGYAAIPNPDLRPETSRGLELGLRGSWRHARAGLAVYGNRYEDFIESLLALHPDDPQAVPGLITFQSRNLERVAIEGAELSAQAGLEALSPRLAGLSVRGAAAWSRGKDRDSGEPLASVDPPRLVLGVAWTRADDGLGAELVGTAVRGQSRVPQIAHHGYGLLDLLAWWRPVPAVTVNAGVFNLADRSYLEWADARIAALAPDSPSRDRFTAPGRNAAVTVRLAW